MSDLSTFLRHLVSVMRLFHFTSACVNEAPFSKFLRIINERSQGSLCRQGHKFGNFTCSACSLFISFFQFLLETGKKFIKCMLHHWFSPFGKLLNVCLLRGVTCPFLRLTKENVDTSV